MMRYFLLALVLLAPLPARAATAPHAMVVSAEPHATEAALAVLRRGGNAVDAAVALAYTLAVAYPQAGNLGGGGFMVGRLANGQAFALDFREMAPAATGPTTYLSDPNLSLVGYKAAGVPGTVRGLCLAARRWGTLPVSELIEPARRLAADGFAVPAGLHRDLVAQQALMTRFPATAALFYPGGQPLAEGALLRQPALAQTLAAIQREGDRGFYEGPVADRIAQTMAQNGGFITREDLKNYRAVEREPVRFTYRGYEGVSMPPPSSGGSTLAEILNTLEPFDLHALGFHTPASIHLMAEAMRRAYVDRNRFLGDPDYVAVPLRGLISKSHGLVHAAAIDPRRARRTEALMPAVERPETTHFSVVDPMGNAVACTVTLNGLFGSKAMAAGFLLNNEMDDFTTAPGRPNLYGLVQGEANAVAPGKRPLSSMTPTILSRNGQLQMVVGTPGGSTIITTVLQVITGVIDHGLDLQAAVDAPRLHHQAIPDQLFVEPGGLPPATVQALTRMGHRVVFRDGTTGSVQAILRTPQGWVGATDPRGYGVAEGF